MNYKLVIFNAIKTTIWVIALKTKTVRNLLNNVREENEKSYNIDKLFQHRIHHFHHSNVFVVIFSIITTNLPTS